MNKTDVILTLITVPDHHTASSLASMLVEKKLASCVNIVPGLTSYYRWHDRLNSNAEVLLIAKTRRDLFPALRDEVQKVHPYDLPEIIAIDIADGLQAYLDWVVSATAQEDMKT